VNEVHATDQVPRFTDSVRAFAAEFEYLHRAVQRLGIRDPDAEDVVQDVFVVMWRRWGDYQRDRPLRPWMVGIASHLACRHRQRRLREVFVPTPDTADEAPLAEERLASAGVQSLVLQALTALPPRYRLPLVMRELQELSVSEISRLLGVPLATVYTRLRRARLAFAAQVSALTRS
jgi:RNA polymerase sigma factor (sigma-70 family)